MALTEAVQDYLEKLYWFGEADIEPTQANLARAMNVSLLQAERALVSNAVLAKCDALDGATDGLVQDTKACQAAFDLNRDVPTCTGARICSGCADP